MFDKQTICYEEKCRRIGNQQKYIIQIGNWYLDENSMIWINVHMKF